MNLDDQKPWRAKIFVAGLIMVGVGLTGTSMVKRVQAIENQPHFVISILQQSCNTSAYANPMTNVRGESAMMIDRPC